jgi:hypothetical protein
MIVFGQLFPCLKVNLNMAKLLIVTGRMEQNTACTIQFFQDSLTYFTHIKTSFRVLCLFKIMIICIEGDIHVMYQ